MIPENVKESFDRYVRDRCPTGGFLQAVLENNLVESFARADDYNRENLFDIVQYLYSVMPRYCWGSPDAGRNWLEM
jgi:hypothetical protein